jgi:pimeloyl-ACP methyl ester carboxylesterase
MKLAQKLAINYTRSILHILALVSRKKAARKAYDLFCTPQRRSKNKSTELFNKGERLSFRLSGNRIRGHRWLPHHLKGTPIKKVLLIHGFESSSKNFDFYIPLLLRKGYEVLAFDAPAHGQSGGKQINLALYIRTLAAIHDKFGPIQSFLAHSFGGLAITHFLENIPYDEKTKLVLIAPATESKTSIDQFFHFLQLDWGTRTEFDNLIFEKIGSRPEDLSIRRAMKNSRVKVLWFHDQEDQITPLKDALPVKEEHPENIELIITNGLGHRKIYKNVDVIKKAVDFL